MIEVMKEPYELFGRFIGEIFEGERRSGTMDEGEEEEPGEELSVFFGDDELLGDGGGRVAVRVSGSGGGSGSKERGVEEEEKSFALVVGKFDGVDWWWCWRRRGGCRGGVGGRLTIVVVGGENEGEEFFGVGSGVQ